TLATKVPAAEAPKKPRKAAKKDTPAPDLVVFGGSGVIGSHMVSKLVEAGRPVRVVSRGAGDQSPPFDSPLVEVMRGSVTNRDDVERALAGAGTVVNLAHGGGGTNWDEIKRSMVDSGVSVAEC